MSTWLERLCAHDTTTGREDRGLDTLVALLRELGARVHLQPIESGRSNVLATWGEPRVLFSTHVDTVPPYLPPQRAPEGLWGRGTADAKGQAIAQLAAIRSLLAEGRDGCAWLGIVGEETDSIGAKRALELAPQLAGCRALLNGEPTHNELATGQRGILSLRLSCSGKAAHSGTPELGRSALWPLLEWLQRLRSIAGPHDQDLGPEIWNLGELAGGEAPNVVPANAHASVFARTLPGSSFLEDVRRLAPPEGRVEVLAETPSDRFPRHAGFRYAPVPFGSDAPRLRALAQGGEVVLVGPGRIELAHGLDEHLRDDELAEGYALLLRLARHFETRHAAEARP
jgi:acetylornithine deacetylase